MRRWDIILTPFPFTDLSGQKVRPALVLFVDKTKSNMIVAFLTSNLAKKDGFDVAVTKSSENGLRIDSVLCVSKLATLDTRCAIGRLGTLESIYQGRVRRSLFDIFGFIEK